MGVESQQKPAVQRSGQVWPSNLIAKGFCLNFSSTAQNLANSTWLDGK